MKETPTMHATSRTLLALGAALSLAGSAGTAGAQQRAVTEIRPFVGAFVPTGDNRDLFKDAFLAGISAGYAVHPNVAVVGTFGWALTELKSVEGIIGDNDL